MWSLLFCYFCWLDGRYSTGSSKCVVGCWPILAGCNCISYWRTFCWYTYSYFYLKLDEKEQSDKPPQQSSTKKTGKEKCFINNWNHKTVKRLNNKFLTFCWLCFASVGIYFWSHLSYISSSFCGTKCWFFTAPNISDINALVTIVITSAWLVKYAV